MVELADIFHRHGSEYQIKFEKGMLPSHKRAMRDIELCRTPALGGEVFACPEHPDEIKYSYHSCKNRACPKCQNHETTRWLEKQKELLLPVDYFMVTYTLPKECREITRSHQKTVYSLFFKASAKTFMELAGDKKHLGGQTGLMGVLQTWARNMAYHVHIHYIVPGGALSFDGKIWIPHRYEDWLVPVKVLSARFKKHFKEELAKIGLLEQVDAKVWNKDWVVHCEPVGSGCEVLKYIAPYIYRVAISNNRIESLDNATVTFQYKSNDGQWQHSSLDAEEFIRRFLQHVLPKGFVKIRYFGFLAARNRKKSLPKIRNLQQKESGTIEQFKMKSHSTAPTSNMEHLCSKCGRDMKLIHRFLRNTQNKRAPPNGWIYV